MNTRDSYYGAINDFYYRGDHQLLGSITLTVTADDFANASPESPIFLCLELNDGAVLADTRVDQTGDDALLSRPIFLGSEMVSNGTSSIEVPVI